MESGTACSNPGGILAGLPSGMVATLKKADDDDDDDGSSSFNKYVVRTLNHAC